jgi:hypothetical protein
MDLSERIGPAEAQDLSPPASPIRPRCCCPRIPILLTAGIVGPHLPQFAVLRRQHIGPMQPILHQAAMQSVAIAVAAIVDEPAGRPWRAGCWRPRPKAAGRGGHSVRRGGSQQTECRKIADDSWRWRNSSSAPMLAALNGCRTATRTSDQMPELASDTLVSGATCPKLLPCIAPCCSPPAPRSPMAPRR